MAMFGKAGKALASPAGQEALYLLGATLKDLGGNGDNFLMAQQQLDARRKKADEDAAFADLSGLFGGGQQPSPVLAGGQGADTLAGGTGAARPTGWSVMDGAQALTGAGVGGAGNPGEMGGMTPDMQRRALVGYFKKTKDIDALLKLMSADQPSYERGPDGFYETRPGQIPRRVTQFEQKPEKPDVPMGMEVGPDGRLQWRPGYVEAQKLLGENRRDILLEKPLPVRRGGGGGGRTAKPAAGGGATARPLGVQLDPNDGW